MIYFTESIRKQITKFAEALNERKWLLETVTELRSKSGRPSKAGQAVGWTVLDKKVMQKHRVESLES